MESTAPTSKVTVMQSDKIAKAVGPFCPGKFIHFPDGSVQGYTSGQLGLDPATNKLVEPKEGEDLVVAQAHQVLTNLKNLVEDNGFDFEKHCIKNTVFLVDMGDFAKVNDVYRKFFTSEFPARTCIAVSALPLGGKVEVESILFKPAH